MSRGLSSGGGQSVHWVGGGPIIRLEPWRTPEPETERRRKRVMRYPAPVRERISQFAVQGRAHVDLLQSFPAAAVAIACGYGPAHHRGEARWRLRTGAGLAEVADALEIPMWLRRLPPEAFAEPLPYPVAPDAQDEDFGRKVLNSLPPAHDGLEATWLRAVLEARRIADDEVALWLARRLAGGESLDADRRTLRRIALYAWASRHGEGPVADVIEKRWGPELSLARATAQASSWAIALAGACRRPHGAAAARRIADWSATHEVGGYAFAPILRAEDAAAEGRALRNCLGRYGRLIAAGACHVFAVRRDGASVAALEIRLDDRLPPRAFVSQIRGPANGPAPAELLRAARQWIAQREAFPPELCGQGLHRFVDRDAWFDAWRGYLSCKRARLDGLRAVVEPAELICRASASDLPV